MNERDELEARINSALAAYEERTFQWEAAVARAERLAEALRDAAEPLYDETFRARLLRHGLSNEEIAQFVDAIETMQRNAAGVLGDVAGTRPEPQP